MSHSPKLREELSKVVEVLEKQSKLYDRLVKVTEDEELQIIQYTVYAYLFSRQIVFSFNQHIK